MLVEISKYYNIIKQLLKTDKGFNTNVFVYKGDKKLRFTGLHLDGSWIKFWPYRESGLHEPEFFTWNSKMLIEKYDLFKLIFQGD